VLERRFKILDGEARSSALRLAAASFLYGIL
jgi:hypothetical protein